MRRIVSAASATVAIIVLLFSYHTSTNQAGADTVAVRQAPGYGSDSGSGSSGSGSSGSGSSGSGSSGSGSSGSGSAAEAGTYDGRTVQTRWGPVQVRITVSGGEVTRAEAIQYPNGNHRDQEINDYALPILNREVVAAQSAGIDGVSGATVTSEGYIQSLQSALDAAHLG